MKIIISKSAMKIEADDRDSDARETSTNSHSREHRSILTLRFEEPSGFFAFAFAMLAVRLKRRLYTQFVVLAGKKRATI